ncbi:MAG: hypothetical protein J6M47_02985 [Clostridia bacterium]|nr:hypothetical protein [Clostridia bacterium]
MNMFRKLLCCFVVLALCMGLSCAQAATVTKDGLTVSLTADKAAYREGEQVRLSLTVESDGSMEIAGPSVSFEVPDVLVPGRDALPDLAALTPGKAAVFSAAFTVVPDMTNADGADELPVTGDSSHMALWLLLLALSCAGVMRLGKKARRQLFALLLCLATAGSMLGVCAVQAEGAEGEIRVTETITIMGKKLDVTAVVRYAAQPAAAADGDVKKDASKLYYLSNFEGVRLQDSIQSNTTTVYDKIYTDDIALPESAHPYDADVDQLYGIGSWDAKRVTITFSEDSELENRWDLLLIYDGDGNYIDGFTGTEMAGKKIHILSHAAIIRLLSDSSVTKNGFKVSAYSDIGTPEVTCVNNGGGSVTVSWNKQSSSITGYRVERATISSDGVIGTYKTLKASTTVKTSYTDKTAVEGKHYSYRVRQTFKYNGAKYTTDYGTAEVLVLGKTSITSGMATMVGSSPAVALSWKALAGASRYEVWRSETKTGTYTCVGSTTGTGYTDLLPEEKIYYYKILPYGTVSGVDYPGAYSAVKPFGYAPIPTSLAAYGTAASRVTLSWDKAPGVTGYLVYRSATPDGTYKRIAKTSSTKLTDVYSPANTTSYFKIRSYVTVDGVTTSSGYSEALPVYPLTKPTGLTGSRVSNTSVRLSWNAITGATGYEVYQSNTKSGTYKLLGSVSGTSCTVQNLTESYEYAHFKIRAIRSENGAVSRSGSSSVRSIRKNPETLRVLQIVEENFPDAGSYRQNAYNSSKTLLNRILSKATPLGEKVTTKYQYKDQSKSQLLSRISTMAGYADDNDVTLFYLGSHGSSNGYVYLSDGNYISTAELADALSDIPGRVIVLLDYCFSGLGIGKGVSDGSETKYENPILDPFAELDMQASFAPSADGDVSKSGEMAVGGKFYVFTSARGTESSWRTTDGTFFMQWMNSGVMGADSNKNGTVTQKEMAAYLKKKGSAKRFYDSSSGMYVRMIPQAYPTSSSFELFVD